ncbi:hypothetical protein CH63R_09372 [Colletotrichum higginsianum IMI 349063]|uniref:Uncharacterized protein n=1 Tax=Colletotrichum higginsianum (strain IMI 349063) TaxID=759273 RepID=A0A1B7Y738_COLHI|nr:hypothetical protein CH63R_09372 [Colletotrichum higginsianum IMI 349063]OBR07851.1 hypothetical protein CH63R_09372 [Colletotrichum higginsianum IMI 349063]
MSFCHGCVELSDDYPRRRRNSHAHIPFGPGKTTEIWVVGKLKNLSICEARLACDLPPLQQMTMQRISNGGDFPFFLSFSYLLSYLSFSDVNSYGEFTAHNGTTTSYCLHFRDPALGSDWRPRRGFENWLSRHQGRASHQSHFFLPSHHRQRGSLHQLYHRRGEGQPGVSFFR